MSADRHKQDVASALCFQPLSDFISFKNTWVIFFWHVRTANNSNLHDRDSRNSKEKKKNLGNACFFVG